MFPSTGAAHPDATGYGVPSAPAGPAQPAAAPLMTPVPAMHHVPPAAPFPVMSPGPPTAPFPTATAPMAAVPVMPAMPAMTTPTGFDPGFRAAVPGAMPAAAPFVPTPAPMPRVPAPAPAASRISTPVYDEVVAEWAAFGRYWPGADWFADVELPGHVYAPHPPAPGDPSRPQPF
ncbi:hypothetical protein LG634_07010 [Streptomyces bambusae]|uniref:hypothetical protein n=1 Tax=Streptomyces bambusae TaxID=1550616 RepID=UPI001CFE25F3|nr:hypothetical protein [Streptomyces bambusae]MCB5164583.1 hypothetical protein [Streptomyces bambusae]